MVKAQVGSLVPFQQCSLYFKSFVYFLEYKKPQGSSFNFFLYFIPWKIMTSLKILALLKLVFKNKIWTPFHWYWGIIATWLSHHTGLEFTSVSICMLCIYHLCYLKNDLLLILQLKPNELTLTGFIVVFKIPYL